MLSQRVRRGCLRLGLAGLVPAIAFGLIAVAIGLHSDWQRSQSPISLRTADVTIELPASFSAMDAPRLCKAMRDTRGPWNHFQAGRTVPLPGVAPLDKTSLDRVKRNVARMVSLNAPKADIEAYIASENASVDQIRAHTSQGAMSKVEAMLEAERRGILPPEMTAALNEARSRGLLPEPTGSEPQAGAGRFAAPNKDVRTAIAGPPQRAAPTSSATGNPWEGDPLVDPIVDAVASLQGPLSEFTSVGPDECIKRVGIYVNDIRHQGRDAAFATALTSVLFGGGWFICCWGFGWVLRGFMA